MNDKLKFDILQLASKYYLTKQIPDNWYNLNEEEQNKYLSENVWQPFEYHNPDYIWDQIENAASATEEFILIRLPRREVCSNFFCSPRKK
jgi:adenylate kinase family enzyme